MGLYLNSALGLYIMAVLLLIGVFKHQLNTITEVTPKKQKQLKTAMYMIIGNMIIIFMIFVCLAFF